MSPRIVVPQASVRQWPAFTREACRTVAGASCASRLSSRCDAARITSNTARVVGVESSSKDLEEHERKPHQCGTIAGIDPGAFLIRLVESHGHPSYYPHIVEAARLSRSCPAGDFPKPVQPYGALETGHRGTQGKKRGDVTLIE